ncbi:hypothetical protein CTAYLR_000452 [Chrysophaeum taylorii]|uniref:G10 protein n=1 Tax=Chrysophaeum taylorii TaxID=2483200 RepID=A0AAD7XN32_9STRA|nr:hypothetical protein CTAYLR_000452 [Chrysophaeum taylorii]
MSRFARREKEPEGFDYIKPTLEVLEQELRDRVNDPHEGKRKLESQWPIHQINWQRSRYVFDMYWRYHRISREIYDYCIRNKLVDGALMAKWRKPGYERLCSTYVINTKNYNFGTVSICRVPRQALGDDAGVECPTTGCRGCASGPGGQRNIFGNKYGQYLARIQIKREKRQQRREEEEEVVVGRPTGPSVWVDKDEEPLDDVEEEEEEEGPPRPNKMPRLHRPDDDASPDDDPPGPLPPPSE